MLKTPATGDAGNDGSCRSRADPQRDPHPARRALLRGASLAAPASPTRRAECAARASARAAGRRRARRSPASASSPDSTTCAPGASTRPHRARRAASAAPSRILANTRSNGAGARNRSPAEARRRADAFAPSGATPLRRAFVARDAHGFRVDVARQHRARAGPSRPRWPARRCRCRCRALRRGRRALDNPIQRQQAAARRAVMAGAEGERRLDLDADPVRRNARAVMRAVHREAAGRRPASGRPGSPRPSPLRRSARRSAARGRCRAATSSRARAASSGGLSKWISTFQRPSAPSNAAMAVSAVQTLGKRVGEASRGRSRRRRGGRRWYFHCYSWISHFTDRIGRYPLGPNQAPC